MFGFLFGKKMPPGPERTDLVYLKRSMADRALVAALSENGVRAVLCFFRESEARVRSLAADGLTIIDALRDDAGARLKELGGQDVSEIYFIEHHPCLQIETAVLEQLAAQFPSLAAARFYGALDDPLLRVFGSERIEKVMIQLGMKEGEPIDHPFVSKAIANAQRRFVLRDGSSSGGRPQSQEEWIQQFAARQSNK